VSRLPQHIELTADGTHLWPAFGTPTVLTDHLPRSAADRSIKRPD